MSGYLNPEAVANLCKHAREVKRDSWTARCPAHEDNQPSLNIDKGYKGTLLYCHRGCSLDDICAELEITRQQLFHDYDPNTNPTHPATLSLRNLEARLRPPTMRELAPFRTLKDVVYDVLWEPVQPETWAWVGSRWHDTLELPFKVAMRKKWVVLSALCGDLLRDQIDEGYDYSIEEQRRLENRLWETWLTNGPLDST